MQAMVEILIKRIEKHEKEKYRERKK